jgi:riboflavin kinase/FMN adenylyltransferase
VKTVVTIGTFDGVHLGHQALIEAVVARAAAIGIQSAVVTFEPPPVAVLRPDAYRGRITMPEEKLRLLHTTGVDHVEVIPFSRELSEETPETFLRDIAARLGMVELWVGDDFALGRNRSGNVAVISALGAALGYETRVFPRVLLGDHPMSSTAIRQAVQAGDVEHAAAVLGRPFRVSGEVIHGAHLGRKIGFPTANFYPPSGMIPLADGIYASRATVPGHVQDRAAMTYIGTRPTVNGGDRQIETHLLDFEGDLYGTWLTVDLIARIREDRVFPGLDALVDQLRKDEEMTRQILDSVSNRKAIRVDRNPSPC